MAINTQKLLPPGKLTAAERMAASYDRRVDDAFNFQVKEKLIDVDKFLKKDSKEKKKRVVKGKLTKTRKKREKREKELETPKGIKGIEKVKSLIPKTGIVDAVQRFATFTFLGYLLTKFGGETPKLLGILQKVTPILNITEKIIGGIFEGIVGFVDAGYKAYDQMRALSKDIGGEKAQKVYDEFSTNFNRFLNAVLTFGLSELGRGNEKPPEAKSGGGIVRGYQRGGQTTRGGRVVGAAVQRTFRAQKISRPQRVQPEKVNPGKDVGGKLKIEKLYPNPKPSAKRQPNPYKALTGVSENLDKGGWIGQLMSAGVKVALGQKVNASRIAKSVSGGMSSLSQAEQGGLSTVSRSILGMADGGFVPMMGQNSQTTENLLATLIQSRVNEALRSVTEELIRTGGSETGTGGAPGGGGGAPGLGPVPDAYISEDNKKAEADLLEYFSSIYGKNAAVGIVANLWRESGLRTVAPESGYNGMAQWDNTRWSKFSKWAKDNGKDPLSRSAQAQYVAIELKQLGTDKRLRAAKTAEEAASIFYNEFERGSHSRPVVGAAKYDPNNEHEQKNRGFIQQINKRNVSFVSDKIEGSKLSSNILEFRKWRKQNYGVSDQRIASDQTGFLQIRELGKRGRGPLSTEVSKFADDLSYQWWEHSGAGHKENRAFDVPVSDLKMGDRVNQFWRARGYNTIWRSSGHYNHVHVEVPANRAEEFFKIAEKKTKSKTKTKEDQKLKPRTKADLIGSAGARMQGGGFVGSQRRNYSSLSSYPSYDTSGGTMIAIQPIIIEKSIPMSTGGSNQTIAFPVPVSVNNNMASLSRA